MQLFTTLLALTAAIVAADEPVHIPYDCYTESYRNYGKPEGTKVSDKDLISGLDIRRSKLTAIAACTDMKTRLISGVTTTWGIWSGNQWTGVKAMNTIGYMSGLQEFDDFTAASSVGISLSQNADWALQQYWYQEASPEQKTYYMNTKASNDAGGYNAWKQQRQNAFNNADANKDGALDRTEGDNFYKVVRGLDGKTSATDDKVEKLERTWNVASQLSSPPLSMTFQDYLNLEKLMETFYTQGKLEKTGHAKGSTAGADLSHHCKTIKMADENDEIVYIYITSTTNGVAQIELQTKTQPLQSLGEPDSNRLSYTNQNWEQFESNIDSVTGLGGRTFMGLYGWAGSDGHLASLGFIEKDEKCFSSFDSKLGSSLTWNSPIPGTEVARPELPEEYKKFVDDKPGAAGAISDTENPTEKHEEGEHKEGEHKEGEEGHEGHDHDDHEGHDHGDEKAAAAPDNDRIYIPSHEHDNAAEGGLVAVCVIIWVAVAILIIVFFYQYCKEKKGNQSIAYEVQ